MADSEAAHVRGFFFADLRGYTEFVERHGDQAASALLGSYRSLVRAAVAQFHGAEIRTEGDGFYVVFPSPSSAIRCGLQILEQAAASSAAAGGALPVGIGIHAGETEEGGEGFVGSAVNIAARVCALAGPGELLVTETVRSLVRTSLPLALAPRGRRRLKGIREPIALFAIRPAGAAPAARTRRLRSAAAWTRQRRPLAAGFAALVGVAVVATVVLAVGLLTNTNARSGIEAGNQPASSGSASPAPSPSDPGVFPNEAEASLLARLDSSVASFCRRAAASDYPPIQKRAVASHAADVGPRTELLPVYAGLHCPIGGSAPDFVYLWSVAPMYKGDATVDRWFFLRAGTTPLGDCATDERAYMNWSFGPLNGKLLCITTEARTRFDWIFDGVDVIATAERDDGDRAALYQWWLDEGRGILH